MSAKRVLCASIASPADAASIRERMAQLKAMGFYNIIAMTLDPNKRTNLQAQPADVAEVVGEKRLSKRAALEAALATPKYFTFFCEL